MTTTGQLTVAVFLFAVIITGAGSSQGAPLADGVVAPSRFFDKEKSYSEEMFVLNDFLEFSVFDMSKLGLFINAKQVQLAGTFASVADAPAKQAVVGDDKPADNTAKRDDDGNGGAETEIRSLLGDLPRYFYVSLRRQIEKQQVPVTLNATNSPAYGKPLILYIKLKKISLSPPTIDKKGLRLQPVSLKIYGQLKDKSADNVLFRFYDTAEGEFVAGRAGEALEQVADQLMSDLAKFMATKY